MTKTVYLLGAGALVLIGLYFAFDPAEVSFFPRCPLAATTGLLCAGCGSQRAIHALLHGDIAAAWALNPLLLVALPYVCLGYVARHRARFSPLWRRFRKTAYGTPAIYVVGAVVVAFTIGATSFNLPTMDSVQPPASASDQEPAFFLLENGRSSETAYPLDRLRDRGITAGDYVWREGMGDWRPAGEVAELREALDLRTAPTPRLRSGGTEALPLDRPVGDARLGRDSDAPLEGHRDLVLGATIGVWLFTQVVSLFATVFAIQNWPNDGIEWVSSLLWIVSSAMPIALALLIRERGLRTVALVGAVLLVILSIGSTVYWRFLY